MSKVTHSLIAHDGKYIVMPPHKLGQSGWDNMAEPNVFAPGGDASGMVYPINTKFVDFDRTFIYGYVHTKNGAYTKANIGLFNSATKETVDWGATAGAVGDTLIGLDETTFDVETSAAVNVFAGGYLMPRTNPYGCYRIVSNTVYNGGRTAGEIDFVIEDGGLTAIVDASQASCFVEKNPYSRLWQNWGGARDFQSVMGVTLIDPTAATHQWIQTWGPCMVSSDEKMGGAAKLRIAFFHGDGSIVSGVDMDTDDQFQPAGYCLDDTYTATAPSYAATWFFMLQLVP